MEQPLKVGDRVFLSEIGIRRWAVAGPESSNPTGVLGTVIRAARFDREFNLPIGVAWENGTTNSYSKEDLTRVPATSQLFFDFAAEPSEKKRKGGKE